jgi:S-adenosylmethionine synthetase
LSEQQTLGDEYVERKGIGHPDTLADLIAEECSNEYSKYCIHAFGGILNHWFDKVVLSGGVAELAFGIKKINKPITAYLFGKAVTSLMEKKFQLKNFLKKPVKKF